MFAKLCIVIPILLYIQVASATQDELSSGLADIQQHLEDVKHQLNGEPLSADGEGRRLYGANPYSKILGFYQSETYMANGAPTCDKSGATAPAGAAGVAYGCMEFPSFKAFGSQSYGLTCSNNGAGSITLGAQFYVGTGCAGGVANLPGTVPISSYDVKLDCSTTSTFFSCEGAIVPAAEYSGYRQTTFMDSDVCMGQVYSYANVYRNKATCVDGEVVLDGTKTGIKTTCVGSVLGAGMSTSTGCITASSSSGSASGDQPAERDFLKWDMMQVLNGVDVDTWNGGSLSDNTIAFFSSLSQIYGIDYSSFTNVKVSNAPASVSAEIGASDEIDTSTPRHTQPRHLATSSLMLDYTIMVQPGFGNSYTKEFIYKNITDIHKAKVSSGCTDTDCFTTVLDSFSVSDLSGVTAGDYEGATQPTETNGLPSGSGGSGGGGGGGSSTTVSLTGSGGGGGAGIAVGIFFGLGAIAAIGYYKGVYEPKQQAALAAAQANAGIAPPAPGMGAATANPI